MEVTPAFVIYKDIYLKFKSYTTLDDYDKHQFLAFRRIHKSNMQD